MKSGKGVADDFYKGGMNWTIKGTFSTGGKVSEGIWELGISLDNNTIYHMVFKSLK